MTNFTIQSEFKPNCHICLKQRKIFLNVERDADLDASKIYICDDCIRTFLKFYKNSRLENEDKRLDKLTQGIDGALINNRCSDPACCCNQKDET